MSKFKDEFIVFTIIVLAIFSLGSLYKNYFPPNIYCFAQCEDGVRGLISAGEILDGVAVNKGKGLLSFGPRTFLDRGKHIVEFDLGAEFIDEVDPTITVHIHRIMRNGKSRSYYHSDQIVLSEFIKKPEIEFITEGGPNHEFVLYVNGNTTKVSLNSIKVTRFGDGALYKWRLYVLMGVAFALVLFLLSRVEKSNWIKNKKVSRWVVLGFLCFVYMFIIFQDSRIIAPLSFTGDVPNYVVYADYIYQTGGANISSISDVYDYNRYKDLVGFEIGDPSSHLHEVDGKLFFHHQVGISWLISTAFHVFGRHLEVPYVMSALFILAGLFCFYQILLKYLSPERVGVATLVAGLSAPIIFYSSTIYTESIAFFVILFGFYALFYSCRALEKYLAAVFSGLLLFFKFKYVFILAPMYLLYVAVMFWKKDKISWFVPILFVFFVAAFILHTHEFTGSFNPFSWYGEKVANRSVHTGIPLFTLAGYFVDQRVGMFLIVPFSLLFLIYFKKYIRFVFSEARLLVAACLVFFYIILYAISGSWGGESPAMRPQMAIWGLIMILLFANSGIYVLSARVFFALSIVWSFTMLISGYFMVSYANSYSQFYEMISPNSVHLEKMLPNIQDARVNARKFRSYEY